MTDKIAKAVERLDRTGLLPTLTAETAAMELAAVFVAAVNLLDTEDDTSLVGDAYALNVKIARGNLREAIQRAAEKVLA